MQNAKRYSARRVLRRNSRRNFRRGPHSTRFFRHVTPVPLAFWTRRKFFDAPDSPRFFRHATKKARAIGAHRKIFDATDTPRTFRRVTKSARCIRALRKFRVHCDKPRQTATNQPCDCVSEAWCDLDAILMRRYVMKNIILKVYQKLKSHKNTCFRRKISTKVQLKFN